MVVLKPKSRSEKIVQAVAPKLVKDGTEYGGWTYDSSSITAKSIVYSVGLGEDTSWDEGIMKRFNLQVWGFDPTPKSIKHVRSNVNLGPNFHFTPEGLGMKKGVLTFTKPKNPNYVSMREGKHDGLGETVEVPVDSLENWMQTFGHTHLDILKIDIEGSEYAVLEHWIQKKWFPMDQLLVEFHQRFFEDNIRHNNVLKGLQANGFEIIDNKGGNGQEIAFRKVIGQPSGKPSDKPSGKPIAKPTSESSSESSGGTNTEYIQLGKTMQSKHAFVNIQLLNHGYVEMTKSWICNVRSFPGVLEKTMFITTDQNAYEQLINFDSKLNVVLELYETPKDLTYGQYAYYDFMLFRTKLLLQLLKNDIVIWLTESDAVWLKDPSDVVLNTKGDMVTMSDGTPPQKILQGGFQLLRPTKPTVSVWTKLLTTFQNKMSAAKKGIEMNDSGSEQLMLNGLIRKEPNLNMQWLDWHLFAPGLYYKDKNKFPQPMIILNNWIKGNSAKIARSKKWNHWYLDGNQKCKLTTDKNLI
jgi:FkbM family methyltransferase